MFESLYGRKKSKPPRSLSVFGNIDYIEDGVITGWAWDSQAPADRLEVELLVGKQVCAKAPANIRRADVLAAGMGEGHYGFQIALPMRFCTEGPQQVQLRIKDVDYIIPFQQQQTFTLEPPLPITYIAADVVNNCNLRCPFCLVDYSEVRKTELMTEETFSRIMRFLPLVPTASFWLSCLHEPTLHPRFESLLRLIPPGEGHKFWFTTNLARRLSDEAFHAWAESGLRHINISIDTLDPQLFAVLRKHGKLEVFLDNLERLTSVFRQYPQAPKLRYISMVFESNFEELAAIARRCHDDWLSSEHEVRYMYDVVHVTDEFRQVHLPSNNRWSELRDILDRTGLPHLVVLPADDTYEEERHLPANHFELSRYPYPPESPRFTPPLKLRVRPNGNIYIIGQEWQQPVNVQSMIDPHADLLTLIRQSFAS